LSLADWLLVKQQHKEFNKPSYSKQIEPWGIRFGLESE
jgi:hypothetical protein